MKTLKFKLIEKLGDPAFPKISVNFVLKSSILYYRNSYFNRLVIVIPKKHRQAILTETHDSVLGGCHQGLTKTYDRIKARYYWPTMRKDVISYVKSCHLCQLRKIPKHRPFGHFKFFDIPTETFKYIQIDVSGTYPRSSSGKKFLITCSDIMSKFLVVKAVRKAVTESICDFLLKNIICQYSCPSIVQS